MKKNIIIYLVFIFSHTTYAQFGPKQIIADEGGVEISSFDIDGDGDQDILKAGSNNLAWFENLDGQGDFSPRININGGYNWKSASAADIDGDGDLDIIAYATWWSNPVYASKMAWFENLDGQGDFGPEQMFFFEFDSIITSLFIADVDGDDDNDVLSSSFGNIFWFENEDGLGSFSESNIIATGDMFLDLYVYDFDGDEDLDVLASTRNSEELIWYENEDGLGYFNVQQIIASNTGWAVSIDVSDLDGDGDKDILTISSESYEISWYENMDGLGNFGQQQLISNIEHRGRKILAGDVDNDGDKDVLIATQESAYGLGTMAWYENVDGLGNFGPQQIIHQEDNFGFTLFASDLDGDNDIDVMGTSYSSEVAWFENLLTLSIEDNNELKILIHPNPAHDFLQIENGQNIVTLSIYNTLGRLILLEKQNFNNVDISYVSSGLLFVKLKTTDGTFTYKIVKE